MPHLPHPAGRTVSAAAAFALLSCLMLAACGGSEDVAGDAGDPIVTPSSAGAGRCGDPAERPWCDTRLSPQERTDMLLARMTLRQKIALLGGDTLGSTHVYTGIVDGIPELGIPPLTMSDGPVGAGVRDAPSTALPVPIALGASFDPALSFRSGALVGREAHIRGSELVHAPVGDLVRNPLAGRAFETFGEDPWLATRHVVEWTRGLQSEGVMANVKHYAINTQEGLIGSPPSASALGGRHIVNAVVDERTLRELYLPPFEAAVKEAGAASMMCAYNLVNGAPACGSRHLLQDVLRDDWGFDGFVVSDYVLAVKDTVLSINNGTEIEMPIPLFYQPLLLEFAVLGGLVRESVIDERVGNILRTRFRFGVFDRPEPARDDTRIDQAAHAAIARDSVEQGIVLLRNDGVLPLGTDLKRIAVIGQPAADRIVGGGSSWIPAFHYSEPGKAIAERAGPATEVVSLYGEDADEAAALAATADVALVFVADQTTEGHDKFCLNLDCTLADVPDPLLLSLLGNSVYTLPDPILDPLLTAQPLAPVLENPLRALDLQVPLPLPIALNPYPPVSHRNQDGLIEAVAAANPNTVVILQTGGPVLTPWRERIAALVEAWYPGQEAGTAIARVLFGDTDPGCRLPVTFPDSESDTPVFGRPDRYPGIANQALHSEGLFIGYRWYDAQQIEPAYPFGFGLSYTHFELGELRVAASGDGFVIETTVRNAGTRAGWTVPQLYVALPAPSAEVPQPPRALKGFAKHWLQPSETRTVHFALGERDLSYWDDDAGAWRLAPGCYTAFVGFSSRDLPLSQTLPTAGGSCGG